MTIKPIKLDKENFLIKDKQGFIKHNRKFHIAFGIICIIIFIIALLKIIDMHMFGIGVGIIVAVTAIATKQ
ncbi:hypothetical protein [Clostridium sp.]